MRSTNQIIIAVQESQPVTEEELKLALLAMHSIGYFLKGSLRKLADDVAGDMPPVVLKTRASAAQWLIERMFQAQKADPQKWLGNNVPGNPEYERFRALGKTVFKKATGIDLDAPEQEATK